MRPGSSPNSSASYLYDGEGNRVQQVATTSGTGGATTTTSYIGSLEEIATTGATTTTTACYGRLALSVNGVLSYTFSDGLGSVSASVSASTGQVSATQLYGLYGAVRYQNGTLPTSKGFTGQRSDASTSGLDYYNARYYDPVAGQFTSADSTFSGGLNRYGYVNGNPQSYSDPTGEFPVPLSKGQKFRRFIGKVILWDTEFVAASLGPVSVASHNPVSTGPDTGRAPNGGDDVQVEVQDQPVWGDVAGGSGSPNPPRLHIPENGTGDPSYELRFPNGQPAPADAPAGEQPRSAPSYPRSENTPYHPKPTTRNKPNRWGEPGPFAVTAHRLGQNNWNRDINPSGETAGSPGASPGRWDGVTSGVQQG